MNNSMSIVDPITLPVLIPNKDKDKIIKRILNKTVYLEIKNLDDNEHLLSDIIMYNKQTKSDDFRLGIITELIPMDGTMYDSFSYIAKIECSTMTSFYTIKNIEKRYPAVQLYIDLKGAYLCIGEYNNETPVLI